jgi:hypothetical protein
MSVDVNFRGTPFVLAIFFAVLKSAPNCMQTEKNKFNVAGS